MKVLYEVDQVYPLIPAINQLNAFVNQVEAQRGKKLTEGQADYLVAEAQTIIDSL